MTFTKQQKRTISRILAQERVSEIQPLWDVPRRRYHEDSYTEYGFYQGMECMTDEEIADFFDERVTLRVPSWMYWDCTGQPITLWIHWRRNPNGDVSFIHRIGIDC